MFTGLVQLRTYDKEVTPDGLFVHVKDFYGHEAVVRKSSLTWFLSQRGEASNDRTLRYRLPTSASQLGRTQAPSWSWRAPTREEHIFLGDWCVFQEENEAMFAGRVLQFQYMTGKSKKYTLRSAPTEVPQGIRPREICVFANFYDFDRFGAMQKTGRTSVSIEACKFTIIRPKIDDMNEMTLDLRTLGILIPN